MDSHEIYDICVVGSGPAGLSAAVNSWVRRKKTVVFGAGPGKTKVNLSPRVDNYLGFPGISGNSLYEKFYHHIEEFGIPLVSQKVQNIFPVEGLFTIQSKEHTIQAKSVIIATGVSTQKVLEGEEEYVGKGVSYCATCDGPLFQDRTVAVVDYTGEGAEEAVFLSGICARVIYISPEKPAPDFKKNNIEIIAGEKPLAVIGEESVTALKTTEKTVNTDGIFIFRETYPPAELLPGLEMDGGYIRVNRKMETNLRGVYAAGDCAGKPFQVAKSVGEGQTAALNAVIYLDSSIQ
ncbi:MAG: NAD(P)/FAD-dependent oxidoreductase [Bacillota bacterium]